MIEEPFRSRPVFYNESLPVGHMELIKVLEKVKQKKPKKDCSFLEKKYYTLFNDYVFARNKRRFRPVGILDWAHYTGAGLREAILSNGLDEYYKTMLEDERSPSNIWKDKQKETELKTYYAERKEYYNKQRGA